MAEPAVDPGPLPALAPAVERRLYLVRHAEADAVTAAGHLRSADPIALSPRGRTQAEALRERFAPVQAPVVHARSMVRAAETARLLAGPGREVSLDDRLREISLGDLDGAHARDVFAAAPGWLRDPDAALPGGESMREVADRTGHALAEILAASTSRDVIVVAHGGVNRALLGCLLGLRPERALRIRQDWACVNVLDRARGRWWVGALNWTPFGVNELALTRLAAGLGDEEWRRLGR
jgi:broad specificity phosphatase PhoE